MLGILAFSQQNMYKWRIGIHGGIGNYYGDLSTGRVIDPQSDLLKFWNKPENLSYGLSIERSMSSAWSLRLMSTRGVFQATDRATKWNGDAYDTENYARALNFRTSYFDVDGIFIYHFDNGGFFGEKSRIAPYIGVGVGYMNFQSKGDLYLEDGSRYHYWSDNTIRDISENSPNAPSASIIEQDGIFETDLRSLKTEGKSYSKSALTFPLALGIKFRLNNRFNLNMETLLHYAMNDYLDDVSGEYFSGLGNPEQSYASNPSNFPGTARGGNNKLGDIYGVFNLSIGYNFGYKKQAFKAPIFYLGSTTTPPVEVPTDTITNPIDKVNSTIISPVNTTSNDVVIDNEGKTIIIRDTIYQAGTVVKETVIIKTDTVRQIIKMEVDPVVIPKNNTATPIDSVVKVEDRTENLVKVTPVNPSPVSTKIDTIINIDPITLKEDTFAYAGKILIEVVPNGPVFNLNTLKDTKLDDINPVFFEENIGYLKDDISEKGKVLAQVQESNFELVALRNEINELKVKKNKDQAEIDNLYTKLDEISLEQAKLEAYRASLLNSPSNGNAAEDLEIDKAADLLKDALAIVRGDIIYLQTPDSPVIAPVEYDRIKAENEAELNELEEEMRKLRKDVRKSKRKDSASWVKNSSRAKDNSKTGGVSNPSRAKDKNTVGNTVLPDTTVVNQSNTAAELAYQLQIESLQKDLTTMQETRDQSDAIKQAEINLLTLKLEELGKKVETATATDNPNSKVLEYISALEKKMDDMNAKLTATEAELKAISGRPAAPNTTIITRPAAKPQQLITEVSSAQSAVDRMGVVNIYYNTGKFGVRAEFYNELDRVASLMRQYPSITARLTGFTDKSGNPTTNLSLSKKRSESVSNYLTSRGISSSRIMTGYVGDSGANGSNDPFSRRVEITLLTY